MHVAYHATLQDWMDRLAKLVRNGDTVVKNTIMQVPATIPHVVIPEASVSVDLAVSRQVD